METIKELSLFSGAGGGLLGTAHLLGWETVCYVEWDDYCTQVLNARIDDGYLHDAPIWDDVRSFDGRPWRGHVDVITAGFPCQPFSVAGAMGAGIDQRNGWPDTRRIIRDVRPRWVYLENVPGLLAGSHGYFGTVLRELAALGYDARWGVLSASAVGAPHRRDRVWIRCWLRDTDCNGESTCAEYAKASELPSMASDTNGYALREQSEQQPKCQSEAEPCVNCEDAADSDGPGRKGLRRSERVSSQHSTASNPCWWSTEPDVGRVADGVAARVDRLRAIGNGQVPRVAAEAWEGLK